MYINTTALQTFKVINLWIILEWFIRVSRRGIYYNYTFKKLFTYVCIAFYISWQVNFVLTRTCTESKFMRKHFWRKLNFHWIISATPQTSHPLCIIPLRSCWLHRLHSAEHSVTLVLNRYLSLWNGLKANSSPSHFDSKIRSTITFLELS